MSRDVAAAYCESLGGALPIPQSQEENDWLRELGDTHLGFTVGDGQELRKVWNIINYQSKLRKLMWYLTYRAISNISYYISLSYYIRSILYMTEL